jgi:hypothetical protein
MLKTLMGLWEPGSESGWPGFRMGKMLVDFQAEGKYPNLRICLKSWVRWMRVLWEGFLSIVAVISSVPRANLVGYLYIKYFYNIHLICFI